MKGTLLGNVGAVGHGAPLDTFETGRKAAEIAGTAVQTRGDSVRPSELRAGCSGITDGV